MNLRLATAALLCWLGCAAVQGSPSGAVQETLEATRAYAAMGDPGAQFNLAVRYQEGRGVKADAAQALVWLRKAAAGGSSEAEHNLALLLARGEGVPVDEKEAARLFRAAAEQGVFEAQKALIVCYGRGLGVEKSAARALAWDFLARRSLELISGQPAGAPPKPPQFGDAGVAEFVTPQGQREFIGRDGSVAQQEADGRRVTRDPKSGAVQTLFPDGSRQLEGDGTSSEGRPVRITDTLDPHGVRVSRRIVNGAETIVELADGQRRIETLGEDEQGRRVTEIRRFAVNGAAGSHRLVREDGVERTGEEVWVIKRWVNQPDGRLARVQERYGLGNVVTEQKVLETRPWPTSAAPPPAKPAAPLPTSGPANTVLRPKMSIDPPLAELATLERELGYYAGATEAEFARARAAARHFVFTLPTTPQKSPGGKPVPLVAPPAVPLKEIPTDRSEVHPFGLFGGQLIRGAQWKNAESEHFVVHYEQEAEAKPVLRSIECAYLVVAQALRLDPGLAQRKMHVFVLRDSAMWARFTKALGMPPGIAGFAYKDELVLGAHDEREVFLATLCHEAAHAVVAHFYPGRKWPLWLNEGFAEYVSAKSRALLRGQKIERYLARPDRVEIGSVVSRVGYGLDDPKFGPENVRAFYAQSEKGVRVLLEKLPADKFPRFANLALAGNPLSACLREAYGESCADAGQFEALINGTP